MSNRDAHERCASSIQRVALLSSTGVGGWVLKSCRPLRVLLPRCVVRCSSRCAVLRGETMWRRERCSRVAGIALPTSSLLQTL